MNTKGNALEGVGFADFFILESYDELRRLNPGKPEDIIFWGKSNIQRIVASHREKVGFVVKGLMVNFRG